jgi:uncharacterized membrane protein YfcA
VVILLAGLVVAAGALLQGAVGFGLALVAAPLLVLLDPALMPVPLLALVTVHALLALRRECGDADWRGVGWALLGRLPGIVVGVLVVAALSRRAFAVLVGATVLLAAVVSVVRWRPRPTPPALLIAGLVSGIGGTATSIGGPPVALLYQDEHGARVRATLAAYFAVGAVLSLGGLAVGGLVTLDALRATALLAPFMVAGFLLSGPVRRLLDRGWTRPAVVGVSGVAGFAVLAQAALSS